MVNRILSLEQVCHQFGNQTVIDRLSLSLASGTIGCLLGASGCGKTTVLRTIAGFERPHSGTISINGQVVNGPGTYCQPAKRGVGMVFQDYALFPHLSVAGNVAFGLKGSRQQQSGHVEEMLAVVGLAGLGKQYPHELSGGQQQRVALARALAAEPSLLLMDEPFSNLDESLREHLSREVRAILKEKKMTALFVTHNQQEAFTLADMIGVMRGGHLLQWGEAATLYEAPVSAYVANFIGEGTLIPVRVENETTLQSALGTVSGDFSTLCAQGQAKRQLLVRPEDLSVAPDGPVQARVERRSFRGPTIMYDLTLATSGAIQALLPNTDDYPVGTALNLCFRPQRVTTFGVTTTGLS